MTDEHDTNNEEMSFEERWPTYLKQIKERMPGVLKEMLDAGVPIYYRDKNGRSVKEMPDGEIIVLEEYDG